MQGELLQLLMNHSGVWPYAIIFGFLLLCGFGLPLPEDIFLFVGGLLSFYRVTDVWLMMLVCFAGVIIGDGTVFTIGHFYGQNLLKRKLAQKILPPKRLEMVRKKLHQQGNKVIFAGRFMPGLRTPIFFSAGSLHLPFRIFLFYDGLAALISVPVIVYSVFYFGEHVDKVIKIVKKVQFGVFGTILAIVLFLAVKTWYAHRKELELEES